MGLRQGGGGGLTPGITCKEKLDCLVFNICTEETMSCAVKGQSVGEISLRQADRFNERQCPRGQTLCCNPVPGTILETRIGLVTGADPLGDFGSPDPEIPGPEICLQPQLRAVINFDFGVTCGKRDSRVYYQAQLSDADGGVGDVTNPGEWPWAVLIFDGEKYIGSGALVENDVVVTTATKVKDYENNPGALTVRLGDFDPRQDGPNIDEDFAHVDMDVICVRIHPRADYPTTLGYNVAVLKMRIKETENIQVQAKILASSVVDVRSAPERPANRPEGVSGFKRNPDKAVDAPTLELRIGLLADINSEVDPLGETRRGGGDVDIFLARSYINTVCLATSTRQFSPGTRCWVAAWGNGRKVQREVDIPLVSTAECERKLRPEFQSRGVPSWDLSPSEICAGGERGKDTCEGEGGAPLVCLDQNTDQFYAVGLVGYGFDCENEIPAVYTNLADPEIKSFIEGAFSNNFC